MCGIAGWVADGPDAEDEGLIASMCDRLGHRGPDGAGHYHDEGAVLGHRRLSIIDLEGGQQPMLNASGNAAITYNGELYNYQELRRELKGKGYVFRTRSDTEVVLAAYELLGEDCVRRFNGIFAFAIWDSTRKRLFVARDHFGVKPVYYARIGRRLVFASEIKALLEDTRVGRDLDVQALDRYLTYRYVPSPDTLLQNVKKLPPGHYLTFSDGSVSIRAFWSSVPVIRHGRDVSQTCSDLLERLDAAVHAQMVSDVPVGLMLSGGLDSAAVLSRMVRHTDERVKTFTVGYQDDDPSNELDEAARTARYFNADHHDLRISDVEFRDLLPRVMWHLEEPLGTTSIVPYFYLSGLASEHVKVVLSGQGADEPFGGYLRHTAESLGYYFRSMPAPLKMCLLRALSCVPGAPETIPRAARTIGVMSTAERFVESYSVFPRADLMRLRGGSHGPVDRVTVCIEPTLDRVSHLDAVAQMLYVDTRVWLPDDLLLYSDKLAMSHSLEVRVPFLDVDLVGFVESIPSRFKISGLSRKRILRRALHACLPREIIRRKKKGFGTPAGTWFRSSLYSYTREVLLDPDSKMQTHLDRRYVASLLDEHADGRLDRERQLFVLLALELWSAAFLK